MDLKIAYHITQKELERKSGGIGLEEMVEAIDTTLLTILLNGHQIDMKALEGHTWSLHMLREFLKTIQEEVKE